ncbi:hypothetical protein DVK05_09795 [Halorubrum sp. Atlit-8R]|uniref:hypothetical protein n=1 Tax=Halorubrum sp. Atlit-8R TaxID=2282126 RepID=UPI000EF1AFE3|nr:hypothetical protein [Halorubrum sp. Atlit-8R]RLM81280.1 hypothetical protein DVK05_09795 [Halorubrum sp. Atlit-8R]
MTALIDTLSRIALEHAQLLAPALAFVLFLVAQRYLGRWPDLWRARRLVLPVLDRLADGDYDAELDVVEGHTAIDVSAAADALPEKTGLRLNTRTLVGTIDAPPSEVRTEFRSMSRVYPNTLASIQYDVDEATGERVWEVGSYAYRPEGFFGMWQFHIRLTPAAGGRQTRVWSHYERSAWRAPVRHYRGVGWSAEEGVREIASLFASDRRFRASDNAV